MSDQQPSPDSLDGIEYVGMPDTPAEQVPDGITQEAKSDEPLELGTPETPEATAEDVAADEDKKKHRSKRWEQRVDTLTARLREAERRAAEAEARINPATAAPAESEPDPTATNEDGTDKYEFGAYDPKYIRDMARYEARQEYRREQQEKAQKDQQQTAYNEQVSKLNEGMVKIEQVGKEKYEDFDDKIAEAIEARGGEPLHPLISVGTAVSPAGADIAYRLATDEKASDRLESLAKTNPQAAAVAFGELEGEFVDDDSDLNLADQMDMARMLGRMKSRLAGKGPSAAAERKVSKAPEPPESRARGTGGRFTPDWSAENVDLNELGKQLR